ncbi:MAG: addiction module protein [Acidobacteria bacterium]|nr:addiction module protein [Acidobacteriota bacterium]
MTEDVAELFKRASDIPEKERAALAGLLIESLESEREPGVEAAWIEEIQRRISDLDAGAVKTIPWQKVQAKLLRLLDEP